MDGDTHEASYSLYTAQQIRAAALETAMQYHAAMSPGGHPLVADLLETAARLEAYVLHGER